MKRKRGTLGRRALGLLVVLFVGSGLLWLWFAEPEPRGAPSVHAKAPASPGAGVEVARAPGTEEAASPAIEAAGAVERVVAPPEASEPRLALRILVRDLVDEHPIAGARIAVHDRGVPDVYLTDEEGACAVSVQESRERLRVRAEAEGYVHTDFPYDRHEQIEEELVRATTLHGRVLAADTNAPVSGARISREHPYCDACAPDVVVTDTDGRYELSEVPLWDSVCIGIDAPGFAPTQREFELRTDETSIELDLHLAHGVEVAGRVLDWGGDGLAGATVSGLATDEEGTFRGRLLPDPRTSRVDVVVHAPGHARLNADVDASGRDLEFRLPRCATLEGVVTDVGGQPVEGAMVFVQVTGPSRSGESSPLYELPDGWWFDDYCPTSTTDPEGRFRTTNVPPWALGVFVRTDARGFQQGESRIQRVGGPDTTQRVDLVLRRPAGAGTWITGLVTINGAQGGSLKGTVSWRGPTRSGQTPFAGRYRIAVEPGDVELAVQLESLPGRFEGDEARVHAEEGQETSHFFALRAPTATISGTVRFEGGAPARGARIVGGCLRNPHDQDDGLFFLTQADAAGRYELRIAELGQPYWVQARVRDEVRSRDGVTTGSSAVDFLLGKSCRALVRLVEADTGAALKAEEDVLVFTRPAGSSGFTHATPESPDADGWYEYWVASPSVDVLVLAPKAGAEAFGSHLVRGVRLEAADGPPPRLELVLARGSSVSLELDQSCAPLPDECELILLEEELWDEVVNDGRWGVAGLALQRRVEFDGERSCVLHGLAPGRYRFKSRPDDIVLEPEEVLVDERFETPVLVRWHR